MPQHKEDGEKKDVESALERFGDLTEQIRIECLLLEETVTELQRIILEIGSETASLRNRAAAANLAQSFYNGVENILKRCSKYKGVPLPSSEHWHSELAERFTEEHHTKYGLPLLFPPEIVAPMTIIRRFRHFIMHGYAMNLDWERMRVNVEHIPSLFPIFRAAVEQFLSHPNTFK